MNQITTAVNQPTLLERVMAYEHPGLINRFQEKLGLAYPQAVELFDDVKRFLFLHDITKEPLPPSKAIDEGWHNFILYTKDYGEFCQKFFGRFIHHCPNDFSAKGHLAGHTVRYTVNRARAIFGNLSANWTTGMLHKGDCSPVGCQPKDCVPGDCDSNE